jgi:hypothetical protein
MRLKLTFKTSFKNGHLKLRLKRTFKTSFKTESLKDINFEINKNFTILISKNKFILLKLLEKQKKSI